MPKIDTYTLRKILQGGEAISEHAVESRCVQSFDYDLESETLSVTFPGTDGKGGAGTWQYNGFPLDEFVIFATSSSLGTYFNLYIRGRYQTTRIN